MPHQFGVLARLAGMTLVSLSMVGCLSLGPRALKVDQADYARALGAAKKREILSLIVGLRYADTPAFLTVLRRLQLAGEASIEFKAAANGGEVQLVLGLPDGVESPRNAADIARVHELLNLPAGPEPYLLSPPGMPSGRRSVRVVTRSVLGILSDLGAEIDVPDSDIENGTTKASIHLVGGESRPTLVIHAAKSIRGPAYAEVSYRDSHFWIDDMDFDSKYALTVVQDLMALAEETDVSHVPIVTVPAH